MDSENKREYERTTLAPAGAQAWAGVSHCAGRQCMLLGTLFFLVLFPLSGLCCEVWHIAKLKQKSSPWCLCRAHLTQHASAVVSALSSLAGAAAALQQQQQSTGGKWQSLPEGSMQTSFSHCSCWAPEGSLRMSHMAGTGCKQTPRHPWCPEFLDMVSHLVSFPLAQSALNWGNKSNINRII